MGIRNTGSNYLSGSNLNADVSLNESRVWLSATIIRQILEAETGGKAKRFLLKYWMVWENGNSPFQSSFPPQNPDKTQKSSADPKQKAVPRIPALSWNAVLWSPRQILSGHPGSLAYPQLLSSFRSPGGCMWYQHHHWPCSF